MPDYVEPEYPVETKENSDSNDYIEKLLKEIRDQDNYNEEPLEEITPKVDPKWQGITYFIYSYIISQGMRQGPFLYYVRVKGWVGGLAKYLLFLT